MDYTNEIDDYDFYGAELYANPYPFYHKVRSMYPVHLDGYFGCWIVTTYSDVIAALSNRDLSSERGAREVALRQEEWIALKPLFNRISKLMFYLDPPKHTLLRSLINKAFSARMIENWASRIQKIVDHLLDVVQDQHSMDIIQDIALPLPLITISDMFGIPPQDRTFFKAWSDDLAYFLGNPLSLSQCNQLMHSTDEFMNYFHGIVERHRKDPQEDLTQALLHAEEKGIALTEDELLMNCIGIFVGGHETTTNLIGNGMLALLQNPYAMKRLRENPSLITSAIEELLRYDSPVQFTARIARTDTKIRDTIIYKGQKVMLMLGAANRDPQQFYEPDILTLERKDNKHLAFGHNIHFCIGAALARLEGRIAISTILKRMPDIQLSSQPLKWQENLSYHGLKALPVTF